MASNQCTGSQVADFSEREALLIAREEAIERRERELAEDKHHSFIEFTDGLLREGKIAPCEREAIVSFCMEIDKTDHYFNFSENGKPATRSGVETLKSLFERLKPVIEFGESAPADLNDRKLPQPISASLEADNEQLAQAIKNFAEKHNLDYAEAVQQFNGAI